MVRGQFHTLLASALAACLAASPSGAGERIVSGPVKARILDVIDGDTVRAAAFVWPGHEVTVSVRIRGIDAPEIRSGCEEEKRAALDARAALSGILGDGAVMLRAIEGDKFFGRVLADVETADGSAVAATLLSRDLVRPYNGGRRSPWCS